MRFGLCLVLCVVGAQAYRLAQAHRLAPGTAAVAKVPTNANATMAALWKKVLPACPAFSSLHTGPEDGINTCTCDEGYEAMTESENHRLRGIQLETVRTRGTPSHQWIGKCRKCKCSAVEAQRYSYLFFEGGGVRGIAYSGVVRAFEDAELMQHVEGFSGASAGSQVAAFLAAGISGGELMDELLDLDFNVFADESSGFGTSGFSGLVSKFGYYKGEALEEMMDRIITKRTGLEHTTFAHLRAFCCEAKGACKELQVPALNVNTGRLTWFSPQATPDISVAKAVRASSSIPFFYQPTRITMPDGGSYLFVDGGTLRNLPHDAFEVSAEKPALGFSLRDNGLTGMKTVTEFDGIQAFTMQLYTGLFFGPDSANSLDIAQTLVDLQPIDVGYVQVTDFDMSAMTKGRLVASGYDAAYKQLMMCKDYGLSLPESFVEVPAWLFRRQGNLMQEELAAQVADGITNQGTSAWWNLDITKEALKKYELYNGDVLMSIEGSSSKQRSVELHHVNGNTYIITHMAKGAGPAAHALISEFLLVQNAVIRQASTAESKQCLKTQRVEAARVYAQSKGFDLGGGGYSFAGNYKEGLYSYRSGEYAGRAYFGTGGTEEQERAPFDDGNKYRVAMPDATSISTKSAKEQAKHSCVDLQVDRVETLSYDAFRGRWLGSGKNRIPVTFCQDISADFVKQLCDADHCTEA